MMNDGSVVRSISTMKLGAFSAGSSLMLSKKFGYRLKSTHPYSYRILYFLGKSLKERWILPCIEILPGIVARNDEYFC